MPDAPPLGEDTPTTSHPMVTHRKNQVQATRRQSSRLVDALPQSYAESSPSELSEPESLSWQPKFSATSMQNKHSPVEEALTAVHPRASHRKRSEPNTPSSGSRESAGKRRMVTRGKRLVRSTQRQSAKQNTPSSGDEPFTASHRRGTHGKGLVQVAQGNSSPSDEQMLRQRSVHPSQQANFTRQEFNATHTRFPNPQQFYTPQKGSRAQKHFLPNQENLVISDLSRIDPRLLRLNFKEAETINPNLPLTPDPVLLSIGKPIRIPIWGFRNFRRLDTSHEEPSHIALSDYEEETLSEYDGGSLSDNEGSTDIPTTTSKKTPLGKREATRYRNRTRNSFERRRKLYKPPKPREPRKPRKPTVKHTPVKIRSPIRERTRTRELTAVDNHTFNDKQTRFIILMRAYWGMPYDEITEALSREFEGADEGGPWTGNQVARRLRAVKHDPKFKEYRERWEEARDFRSLSRKG